MNPVLRILKNSTALSLAVVLERGIGFFLSWYVARICGPATWGYYSTALTFITVGSMFAHWGLDQLLPREIARDGERTGRFLASAAVLGGMVSALTTVVGVLIVHFLRYEEPVRTLIYLAIVFVLLPRTEATLCEAVISGLEKMEWIVAVRFPLTILRVGSAVYLLSRGWGFEVLFAVLAGYHVLVCVGYLLLLGRWVPGFRLHVDGSLIRMLGVQAIPFVATISIGETFKQIDRLFLSKLWNTDAVGIYTTGIMLVQIMYLVAPAVMNALFPPLSRTYVTSRERFSVAVSRAFKLLFVGVCPIALAIGALADVFILLVFGQEYRASIPVLQVSAIGIVPSFVARLLYRTLLASNNERVVFRVALVNSVANLILNVWLIPRYGVLGAAISSAFTELIGLTQNLFFCLAGRIVQFDVDRALLRPCACLVVSLPVYFQLATWNRIVAWVISVAVFVGALFVSGTITRRDLAALSLVKGRTVT